MRQKYLLGLLLLSGFAGLSYELLWVRLLALSFGSTTLSFSTVLAVFFGGLALGAWLGGRWSQRTAHPARAYGLIEIGTGASAFILYFVLKHLGSFFVLIDPGPTLAGAVVRFLVATPILLVPTILMGATLPLVSRAIIAEDSDVGEASALIYGLNTLGACLGVYLVTYHLLPALGVFGTNLLTVAVNLAVGVSAVVLGKSAPPPPPAPRADDSKSAAPKKLMRVAIALTFLGGFCAIGFQVVWARLFAIFLDGTVYAIGSVLIAVLIGIGAGSLAISRVLRRASHPGVWFVGLQLAGGLSIIAITALLPWIAYLLRDPPIVAPSLGRLHSQLAIVFAVLSVPMLCSGASFPALLRIVEQRAANASRSLGNLYAANTVGSILGSLACGFVLLPEFGSVATILVALALLSAVGAVGAVFLTDLERTPALALAGAALIPVALFGGFDAQQLARPPNPTGFASARALNAKPLLFFAEGRTSNVAVVNQPPGRGLLVNGLGQGSVFAQLPHYPLESIMVGVMPMIHAVDPKSALVVGLGTGGSVDVLVKLGVPKVTVIELEDRVVDALPSLYPDRPHPLTESAVHSEINDARHYLLLSAHAGQRFDVITSMPAHPWVASGIFTQEFFALARQSLSERGVFSTWFGNPNLDHATIASLLRAFAAVFPNYVVYYVTSASSYYLIGSASPLSFDLERMRALQRSPFLSQARESVFSMPMQVYATGTEETPPPPDGVVNTDDSAFVELHTPRSSTSAVLLADFMPAEYILPALAPEPKHEFYRELMELQLGTAEGRIPLGEVPRAIAAAKRTLAGVRSLLSAEERDYFDGRLAARNDAKAKLEAAAQGADAVIAERARKFLALSIPDPRLRADALAQLAPTGDVLSTLAELDLPRALAMAAAGTAIAEEKDPVGWIMQRSAKPELLSAEEREAFDRVVGPRLAKVQQVEVLGLCSKLARDNGLEAQAALCEKWWTAKRTGRAGALIREASAAGRRGDFGAAAAALEKALVLKPDDVKAAQLLIRAYVERGDEAGLGRLRGALLFQGVAPEMVRSFEDAARTAKMD